MSQVAKRDRSRDDATRAALFPKLLRQIQLGPELPRQPQLSLEPVDPFFFFVKDRLQELACPVVAACRRECDPGVEALHRLELEREIDLVLLDGMLAHPHRRQAL